MRIRQQLEVLARFGIELRPGVGVRELLEAMEPELYESEPFVLLLTVMGGAGESLSGQPLADGIWHLDTEHLAASRDYAEIATRMAGLARGLLPLMKIADGVDEEARQGWVSFDLADQSFRWDIDLDADRIDLELLGRFAGLLAQRSLTARYTYLGIGENDLLVGCLKQDLLAELRESTGLNFRWLV